MILAAYLDNIVVDTKPTLLGNQGPPDVWPTAASSFKIDWGNLRTPVREALPTPPPILNSPPSFSTVEGPEMEREKIITCQDSPSYSALAGLLLRHNL